MTSPHPRSLMTLVLLSAFAACSDSNPDSWFIISEPSKGGLTAGIVKDGDSSNLSLVQTPGGSRAFLLRDKTGPESREQYYAVSSDLVLEKQASGLVVESPAFEAGRRSFPASTELELGKDSATLIKLSLPASADSKAETWWISGWGNLLIQKSAEGLTIYRADRAAQGLDPRAQIRARGRSYEITDEMGKVLLLQPGPPPEPEQRMAYVEERKAVQFFDASGQVVAELPAEGIEIAPEGQAFFLTGRYPHGLSGISDRPLTVLIPRHNRHLILLTR